MLFLPPGCDLERGHSWFRLAIFPLKLTRSVRPISYRCLSWQGLVKPQETASYPFRGSFYCHHLIKPWQCPLEGDDDRASLSCHGWDGSFSDEVFGHQGGAIHDDSHQTYLQVADDNWFDTEFQFLINSFFCYIEWCVIRPYIVIVEIPNVLQKLFFATM